jgi:uncharacterized membrane protein
MAKQENDTLYVIAAAYDDVDLAVADYEAVKSLYRQVRTSRDFDAAVIAKDENGKVHIVKKHEQPTRHGTAVGLGRGLAVGDTTALFPPIGIGIAAAPGGAGAAIGGVAGHASGGMSRRDLKDLGGTLDTGQVGLIARRRPRAGRRGHGAGEAADPRPESGGALAGGSGDHDRDRRLTAPEGSGTALLGA